MQNINIKLPSRVQLRTNQFGMAVYTNCKDPSQFPTIKIQLDEYIYELPGIAYMNQYKN